jgi:hypothetical protein
MKARLLNSELGRKKLELVYQAGRREEMKYACQGSQSLDLWIYESDVLSIPQT